MMNLKTIHVTLCVLSIITGCSGAGIGSEVKNRSNYLGCYEYNKIPVLIIRYNRVKNINNGDITKINGFLKIRDSDFILTENQMIFDDHGNLQFTKLDSGFQYEFNRRSRTPMLMLYDKNGNEFDLMKNGDKCLRN